MNKHRSTQNFLSTRNMQFRKIIFTTYKRYSTPSRWKISSAHMFLSNVLMELISLNFFGTCSKYQITNWGFNKQGGHTCKGQAACLAAGEAWKAIFELTPALRTRGFDSSGWCLGREVTAKTGNRTCDLSSRSVHSLHNSATSPFNSSTQAGMAEGRGCPKSSATLRWCSRKAENAP